MSKKLKREKILATVFRWWFVGAIYFFIGFGTNAGATTSPIDLIFFLGVGIGLANIFIFHPIIYNMFTITRRGKIINTKYFNRTIIQNVLLSLAEVIRSLGVVILVFMVYQILNVSLVSILGVAEGTVLVPGEPILFAIIYVAFYKLSDKIVDNVHLLIEKVTKAEKE